MTTTEHVARNFFHFVPVVVRNHGKQMSFVLFDINQSISIFTQDSLVSSH